MRLLSRIRNTLKRIVEPFYRSATVAAEQSQSRSRTESKTKRRRRKITRTKARTSSASPTGTRSQQTSTSTRSTTRSRSKTNSEQEKELVIFDTDDTQTDQTAIWRTQSSMYSDKEWQALRAENDAIDVQSLVQSRSSVISLIPFAKKYIKKQPKIRYDPWMSWEKLRQRDELYSRAQARCNTAWNVALFQDEEKIKLDNDELLEPKVSLNQRARRITFSVLDRSKQLKDSFNLDEFPMKNS